MGKKNKNKYTFPKKIFGVKVPKKFRKFAVTPIGSAIIAETVVKGAFEIAHSDRVQNAAGKAASSVGHAGSGSTHLATSLIGAALAPVVAAAHEIVDKAGDQRRVGSNDYEPSSFSFGDDKPKKKKKKDKKKKAKSRDYGITSAA